MKYLDVIFAVVITLLVFGHHVLINGFTRFDLHPAVAAIGIFFAVFGAYKFVLGRLKDKD